MFIPSNTKKAFTLVELLTVIGIISLLLAIALPGLNKARIQAKVSGDKASLRNIAVAVEQFAGDMGHYPESRARTQNEFSQFDTRDPALPLNIINQSSGTTPPDQGAHRLFEALAGLDMMGYQKEHYYQVNNGEVDASRVPIGKPIAPNKFGVLDDTQRYGPYIDLDSVKSSNMQEAHLNTTYFPAASGGNSNPVFIGTLQRTENRPILYYKAYRNRSSLLSMNGSPIYDYVDNSAITMDQNSSDSSYYYQKWSGSGNIVNATYEFQSYLWDPDTGVDSSGGNDPTQRMNSPYARPYNKETFILIHAGLDNEYGTADDITNFEKKNLSGQI